MPNELIPRIEAWYRDQEMGQDFQVVAVDDENETIELQYSNGDIGEMDFSSWREASIEPIEPPEDAGAPYDDLELDDFGYSDADRHGPDDLTLDDILVERGDD